MRTTNEVIEAARMGEPCTEEELRLAIISMRTTAILAHMKHLAWCADEELPPLVRSSAKNLWEAVNIGWNVPLEERVHPMDWPGHPSLAHRKKVANAVWDKAVEAAERKK